MYRFSPLEPIDYLIIGHLTQDLTPHGPRLGGTTTYSALTARAMGLRVGVLTACGEGLDMPELKQEGIHVIAMRSDVTTTFENIHTPVGRIQYLHSVASTIHLSMVPEAWRSTPIVHMGPVAREIELNLARAFTNSFVGLTPQGWMRTWDADGLVSFGEWPEASYVLQSASAAVISVHDVHGNEEIIEEMASSIRVLAVTDGPNGARLYWNGDLRHFRPPEVAEIDPTGAGDIFASAFFIRLHATRDPWEAARFATNLASYSVLRVGLDGIPRSEEIQAAMIEVI
jgi:hypothetical protein